MWSAYYKKRGKKYASRLVITLTRKPTFAKLSKDSEIMAINLVEAKNRANKILYGVPILEYNSENWLTMVFLKKREAAI